MFVSLAAKSGMFVCPRIIAPAALSFATTVASIGATQLEPGDQVAAPSGARHQSAHAGIRLGDDRYSPQWSALESSARGLRGGVLRRGRGQRAPRRRRAARRDNTRSYFAIRARYQRVTCVAVYFRASYKACRRGMVTSSRSWSIASCGASARTNPAGRPSAAETRGQQWNGGGRRGSAHEFAARQVCCHDPAGWW